MAKDGLGTIITLGIVGVGGYFLYSSGMLSSLFGSTPAPTTPPTTNPPPAGGTNPVVAPPTPPPPPAGPSCSPNGALAKILALASAANPTLKLGPSGTDTLSIDQWDYYGNQYCSGMMDQQGINADTLFPNDPNRGGPLNYNAFAGWAAQKGLSAYRGLGARRRRRSKVVMIGTHPVRRVA